MDLDREAALAQIDDVLAMEGVGPAGRLTRLVATILRLVPPSSPYAIQANAMLTSQGSSATRLGVVSGALRSLRADIEQGYLTSVEQKTREEIFDDMLSMAEEVSTSALPAPAAFLAGAVLEEHIRKLAEANGIETTKPNGDMVKFENLSQSLVTAEVIRQPERKIIAAWYGQRTEAAHGRFENVVVDEVGRMIQGIREFLVRYPA